MGAVTKPKRHRIRYELSLTKFLIEQGFIATRFPGSKSNHYFGDVLAVKCPHVLLIEVKSTSTNLPVTQLLRESQRTKQCPPNALCLIALYRIHKNHSTLEFYKFENGIIDGPFTLNEVLNENSGA